VSFKLLEAEGEDDDTGFLKFYVVETGTATTEANWIDIPGCTQSIDLVEGSIEELEGHMTINFETGLVAGAGISTLEGPTNHRLRCPGADPIVVQEPAPSNWMKLPIPGTQLGEDGHTIQGSLSEYDASTRTTTTSEWNLSSEREE
jgi:hypothetical protein